MPDTFRVERSTLIAAPPAEIAPLIEDFHRWTQWSPYDKLDPDQQRSYSGAARGVGAVYEWAGKKAGVGRMEITAVEPARITIKLDFSRPMKASNTAFFELEPQGEHTKLTWAMQGASGLMHKVMGLFMSMDNLVGKDFEKGLAELKTLAERQPAAA